MRTSRWGVSQPPRCCSWRCAACGSRTGRSFRCRYATSQWWCRSGAACRCVSRRRWKRKISRKPSVRGTVRSRCCPVTDTDCIRYRAAAAAYRCLKSSCHRYPGRSLPALLRFPPCSEWQSGTPRGTFPHSRHRCIAVRNIRFCNMFLQLPSHRRSGHLGSRLRPSRRSSGGC